jgi:hypothetical protein
MRHTLLEKCEAVIEQTLFPYVQHNLRTAKIFGDLVAFHLDSLGGQGASLSLNPHSVEGSL